MDNAYDANRKEITTARFSCCHKSDTQIFLLANAPKTLSVHATMKGNIRMKNQYITLTSIILALSCFAFLPKTQALTPTPDGCYPGFTTAEGCNALSHLTSGVGNTGLGWYALFGTSTGSYNTGVGAGTLVTNNSDSNTAVGTAALLLNTAGTGNSALGTAALVNNDNGTNNTAVGSFALQNNTNGSNIIAVGAGAGTDPDLVTNNVYIGDPGFAGDENVISIGGIAASGTPYALTFIGGIYGGEVNTGTALPVYVDTDGHLGTSLVNASGQKMRLRTPQGARPQVTLNEFQKQQNRIAELEATVAHLAATVKDQAAQIEKVSAQIELRKPARRVVVNKK